VSGLKNYGSLFIFAMMSVLLLAGCNTATTDEIVDYNNEFFITDYLAETETMIDLWDELEAVYLEDAYEERAIFYEHELVPQAEKIVDLVKNKKIEAEELQEVHNLLVQSEEAQLASFEKELLYLQGDAEDEALAEEFYDLDDESYELHNEFIEAYEELFERFNVEKEE